MRRCFYCGAEVADTASCCTFCGQPLPPASTEPELPKKAETSEYTHRKYLLIAIGCAAIAVILFLAVLIILLGSKSDSDEEPTRKLNLKEETETSQAADTSGTTLPDITATTPAPDNTTVPTLPEETLAPTVPTEPSVPTIPSIPETPNTPTEPVIPTVPSTPTEPIIPTEPTEPPYVSPYLQYLDVYPAYVLPGSNTTYLTAANISGLSSLEQTLALQEIYARHGVSTADSDLQAYFDARSWYVKKAEGYVLNQWETANVILLQTHIALNQGTLINQYLSAVPEDYALAGSSTQELTEYDLLSCSATKLIVARNEIFARHGYVFSDAELQTYFCSKSWYRPSVKGSDFNSAVLTATELKNISLIKDLQPYAGANGCVIPQATVSYEHFYYQDGYCNHIPVLANIPGADELNQQIASNRMGNPELTFTHYILHQKQHIVSFVISSFGPSDATYSDFYLLSALTGKPISNSELYATLGVSQTAVDIAVQNGLIDSMDHHWAATIPYEYRESFREQTLSTENIHAAQPFLDSNGNLWFQAAVFTTAGKGHYKVWIPYIYGLTMSSDCTICGAPFDP